ncbi:MAG: Na+/H+ antiporter NhaC family protein, partial [Opitutales bacterium]
SISLLLFHAVLFSIIESPLMVISPTAVALITVVVMRSAFWGLLNGAAVGALILAEGNPANALTLAVFDFFLPIFQSSWKLSAILFTLILGGFVALVEAGGGLQGLLKRVLASRHSRARMQLTVFGFGFLVFFDGLANTMLVGRLMRSAADRSKVSREKLAYLADATGSAIACVAFISTWIAFQLSMIREGYAQVGLEVDAYRLFFASLPANFYCWFTLFLVLVCVLRDFNPGPMGQAESLSQESQSTPSRSDNKEVHASHWGIAIVPIMVLAGSIPVLCYLIGSESLLPFSLEKFALAYGRAEPYVPQILVLSSLAATLVAGASYLLARRDTTCSQSTRGPMRIFLSGVRDIAGPVGILLAAWLLGGVVSHLGAADLVAGLLAGNLPLSFLPLLVFITGALISFSTGTSWGTMAVLMPLAIPAIFTLSGQTDLSPSADVEFYVASAIAAVFSGAVFGDHCSPFSDTTIVASIAAGVEPLDHVKTQLPFALIAASTAAVFGFMPLGFGLSPFISLIAGFALLFFLPAIFRKKH